MIDLSLELKNLESQQSQLESELNQMTGKQSLLSDQIFSSKEKFCHLEADKINTVKAIEILHLIEKSSREVIQKAFENTVTYALRAIYKNDGYSFKLEFSQRGNISELNFKLKSPTTQGYLDLKDCTAGGEHDLIGLALRFVLLQVIRPIPEGPVLLDEPTKQLSSNYRHNEFDFYQFLADRFKKQLIIVSHSKELAELAENKIIIGETDGTD